MSLSRPNSPVFITEGVATGAQPASSSLDSNQNATLINQLHGQNTSNATGAGIPKQVSNVRASVANAQTGATCTVTVLFSQDPTDKNFAGVAILVKGYQGNPQLVQVSSGVGSPTKFVLNNTGENVSFTVQAYGNGGSAPLTSAPTCGATLPQSTGGGFGSSSSSSSPSATFQTQGVNNASQTTLNIESVDSSIKVSNPSGGNVAIQRPDTSCCHTPRHLATHKSYDHTHRDCPCPSSRENPHAGCAVDGVHLRGNGFRCDGNLHFLLRLNE